MNITKEFTDESDYMLNYAEFKGAFETSSKSCPVVGYKLTKSPNNLEFETNLDSMVFIDKNNFVSFNFLGLNRNVDDYFDFYIVAYNSKNIADFFPVRLIKKKNIYLTFLELMESRRRGKNKASG